MGIITALISILAIAGIAALFRARTTLALCPICVGTAATWVWMLMAYYLGYSVDPRAIALLLGGSVVGIAYRLEKNLGPKKSPAIWKITFIPMGFAFGYALLGKNILWSLVLGAIALGVGVWFVQPGAPRHGREKQSVQTLEKKMEDCC